VLDNVQVTAEEKEKAAQLDVEDLD